MTVHSLHHLLAFVITQLGHAAARNETAQTYPAVSRGHSTSVLELSWVARVFHRFQRESTRLFSLTDLSCNSVDIPPAFLSHFRHLHVLVVCGPHAPPYVFNLLLHLPNLDAVDNVIDYPPDCGHRLCYGKETLLVCAHGIVTSFLGHVCVCVR